MSGTDRIFVIGIDTVSWKELNWWRRESLVTLISFGILLGISLDFLSDSESSRLFGPTARRCSTCGSVGRDTGSDGRERWSCGGESILYSPPNHFPVKSPFLSLWIYFNFAYDRNFLSFLHLKI